MPRRLGAQSFCAFGLTFAGSHSAVLAVGFHRSVSDSLGRAIAFELTC
jgi:hypothetical protein